jgi:hypothetical protein
MRHFNGNWVDTAVETWLTTDMTTTQVTGFQEQLAEAIAKRDAARMLYESHPSFNREKRQAGEDLEFWISKVSYLTVAVEREA